MTDSLSELMRQKLQFYSKTAQVITENITNAELKGAKLKEMLPFKEIWKQSPKAKDSLGRSYRDVKNFHMTENHIKTTPYEISREMEAMKITRITREHDNLVRMLKTFSDLQKSILGK